ncbi:MAG: hypothetical protein ABI905_07605 [Betaproteobacteria bacterium]
MNAANQVGTKEQHRAAAAASPSRRSTPSFGVRVEIIDQLLGGTISRASACSCLSICDDKLDDYLREHARDRVMSLEELRMPPAMDPGMHSLWTRVKQLEALLRDRHRELVLLRQIARGRGLM